MSILAYETAMNPVLDEYDSTPHYTRNQYDSTPHYTRNQYDSTIPLEVYDSNHAVYYSVMYSYTNRIRANSNKEVTFEFWELYMEMVTFFWSHHSVFLENTKFTKMIYDWVVDMILLADKIPQSHRGSFLDIAEKIIHHPIMSQCNGNTIF